MNEIWVVARDAPQLLGADLRIGRVVERGEPMQGLIVAVRTVHNSVGLSWAETPNGRQYALVELPLTMLLQISPAIPSTLEWDWDEFRRIVVDRMDQERREEQVIPPGREVWQSPREW